ncbi:hypothetical protein C8R45DRAFT_1222709 [Mycena sanguinolenta]|nr:hypothetical protein C8R45DRAFT_1222709 [Mycena sanguinolenta]
MSGVPLTPIIATPGETSTNSDCRPPFELLLVSSLDRLLVQNLDAEWVKLTPPHHDGAYFYHRLLLLGTDYDISNNNILRDILRDNKSRAETNRPKETFVSAANKAIFIVDHEEEMLATLGRDETVDQRRASYWKYFHVYPCHRKLPDGAEKKAMHVLRLATALNLVKEQKIAPTPFSLQEVQSYIDFFNFSDSICRAGDDDSIYELYIGFQSGLLLASSVAFLAVPNIVDVAQFFIILAIALALGCVLVGFNTGIDEKLSDLEHIPALKDESRVDAITAMVHMMEQHYTALLLTVLLFLLSLFAFTAYSIYASVFVQKVFTVRYLFFAMAAGGLLVIISAITRWNRRFF